MRWFDLKVLVTTASRWDGNSPMMRPPMTVDLNWPSVFEHGEHGAAISATAATGDGGGGGGGGGDGSWGW